MGFIFSGLFWGIILILIGVSIILQMVFKVNIPVFRIVIAFLLIYAGIRVLMGGQWFHPQGNTVVFEDRGVTTKGSQEYNVVFGKANVDATEPLSSGSERIDVNTVFGSSTIRISREVPTMIKVESAFGGANLPDGNTISFGTYIYKNSAYAEGQPYKFIDANVVFGEMNIVER